MLLVGATCVAICAVLCTRLCAYSAFNLIYTHYKLLYTCGRAVPVEDLSVRNLMYNGKPYPRKVKVRVGDVTY